MAKEEGQYESSSLVVLLAFANGRQKGVPPNFTWCELNLTTEIVEC